MDWIELAKDKETGLVEDRISFNSLGTELLSCLAMADQSLCFTLSSLRSNSLLIHSLGHHAVCAQEARTSWDGSAKHWAVCMLIRSSVTRLWLQERVHN